MFPSLLAASSSTDKFVDLDIHLWEWGALVAFIVTLLVVDLLLVHRKPHDISYKEAGIESAIWISIGIAFTGVIYLIGGDQNGGKAAGEYISGFLLEKSLSVDNVFVWAVIFSYFAVPKKYQFRVLFWGIFGALILRAIFIFAGSALIESFTVTLAIFGLILLYTAYKLAFQEETEVDPDKSIVLRAVRKVVPSTDELDGQKLFTLKNGKRLATPLFAVLIMVETTDVVFAIDSVPAIFGVSRDPFIVFSSNAFAILGLRALYFLLGGMQDKFRYLHYGLGGILGFVGVKMLLTFSAEQFEFPSADFHFPTFLSLGIIFGILFVTVVASLIADKRDPQTIAAHMPGPVGDGAHEWADGPNDDQPVGPTGEAEPVGPGGPAEPKG
ncbi:TerC family protein [Aquihabitans sp. G128]|uniref:TerC family protein n=1 Tax=Aquihabitans sp. G128 TaxID=2849779 RepID=UPI001C2342CE|nr:TerC family protein [Aquihabitans sp. G128]QXC62381.1 TerC family protein [Aquihabitans sp. G128]